MSDPALTSCHVLKDTSSLSTERWLPIQFSFGPSNVSVDWMDFGNRDLDGPFFNKIIREMRALTPPPPERSTELSALIDMASHFQPVRPAGIIFHVSRCGSTLLTNFLKVGEGVGALSEAAPLEALFRPNVFSDSPFPVEGWSQARKMIADAVLGIYAHPISGGALKMIVKCCAIDILRIPLIRSIWPGVPSVVVIREPIEVLVSNMAKMAGWCDPRTRMRWRDKRFTSSQADFSKVPVEEYIARGLGGFCKAASRALDETCRVVDYGSLDISRMYKIAEFFDIEMPAPAAEPIRHVLATYAKDSSRQRVFQDDREQKQRSASDLARDLVRQWAQGPYEELRARERW